MDGGQVGGHGAVAAHFHLPLAFALPAQGLGAAQGVDQQFVPGGAGGVVGAQPLGHTADAVAAHFAFAAVGVVNAHESRGPRRLGRADADDAVRPDGKVPGRPFPGQRLDLLRQAGGAAVQVDIVVGAALHLGKG